MDKKDMLKAEYKKKDSLNNLIGSLDKRTAVNNALGFAVFFYTFIYLFYDFTFSLDPLVIQFDSKLLTIHFLLLCAFLANDFFPIKRSVNILNVNDLEFIKSSPVLSNAFNHFLTSHNKFYLWRFRSFVAKYLKETELLIKTLEERQRLETIKLIKDN